MRAVSLLACLLPPLLFPIASAQSSHEVAAEAREGRPFAVPPRDKAGNFGVPEYVLAAESARRAAANVVTVPGSPEVPEFMKIAAKAREDGAVSWTTLVPPRATGGNRRQGPSTAFAPAPDRVIGNEAEELHEIVFINASIEKLAKEEKNGHLDEDKIYFEEWDVTTPWPENKDHSYEVPMAVVLDKSFKKRDQIPSLPTEGVMRAMRNIEPRRQKRSDNHRTMAEGRRLLHSTNVVDIRNRHRPRYAEGK